MLSFLVSSLSSDENNTPSGGSSKIFFAFFFKSILAKIRFYGKIFVKVHRQTRRKPATQSYRGPPGQPVASKKLLLLLSSANLRVLQKQELTKVNTQRYTDVRAEQSRAEQSRAEQSTYNALLFSVACKYRFMKPDDAFRYGFAMP